MAGDYLLSVSAYRPMHLSLYSPTGDPSKPGTGTALLFYGGACAHPELRPAARTSPRRDETVVPLGLLVISFNRLGQHKVYWSCLAKRSPALQACNRMRNSQADGVPRGTGLRRSNHASGVFCFGSPLSVAGVHALKTHRHPSPTLRFTRLFVVKPRPSWDSLLLSFANWPSALPPALRPARGISTGR
jgi:hypothetical protein